MQKTCWSVPKPVSLTEDTTTTGHFCQKLYHAQYSYISSAYLVSPLLLSLCLENYRPPGSVLMFPFCCNRRSRKAQSEAAGALLTQAAMQKKSHQEPAFSPLPVTPPSVFSPVPVNTEPLENAVSSFPGTCYSFGLPTPSQTQNLEHQHPPAHQ